MRTLVAALIVVGLVVGVWLLWPDSAEEATPSTEAAPSTTTTSTVGADTTSTSVASTTTSSTTATTTEPSHVVETVEEAEEILRELWFGWFEGIFNQDEERIREVVVLEDSVDAALDQFGTMEFSTAPTADSVHLSNVELLLTDNECLAAWGELDVSAFRPDATGSQGVYVVRRQDGMWKLLNVWASREDLWQADCDSLLR